MNKRKLVLFMHISLDGYATDINDGLDWIAYNEELEYYAEEVVAQVGIAVYGRKTYQLMESYWPTVLENPDATKHELDHAHWINDIQKLVLSKTLTKQSWNNTIIIKDHISDEINKYKNQTAKDLVVFGSPEAAKVLLDLGLVDELLLTICPVILGTGKTIFNDGINRVNLKLLSSKTFESGIIATRYKIEH